ncbi:MAG TPA: MFS transporter [Candidatus Eisenbacteria bacterium]|jgi:MFS family permease
MRPLVLAITDFRDAARAFSRPARLYLLSEFLAWTGHGMMAVLYNLYLVEGGYQESFVGTAVSVTALGLALVALPAGVLAERWGRRRCLLLGATLDGVGFLVRASVLSPGPILAGGFVAGAGQAMLAIAAAPFITEHSTTKERTHLFSAFFACALLAGVFGSALGGWLPRLALALPGALRPDLLHAYRAALIVGGAFSLSATLPLLRLRGLAEAPLARAGEPVPAHAARRLLPIAINAALIGAGAGLVIPFMNLYFKDRFACSSGQIGLFFSLAQVFTAIASLLGPALARRFGKLRTAVGSQLLSLPFLVTLGIENHLGIAVAAFWVRATLMQASTPLLQTFIMEALPSGLRARATSVINLLWNVGWAVSATLAGLIIQHFGFAVPFYMTATLYAAAATTFWFAFRRTPETPAEPRISEGTKGQRGEAPLLTE